MYENAEWLDTIHFESVEAIKRLQSEHEFILNGRKMIKMGIQF